MASTRKRPRRGPAGGSVLIGGDTGIAGGPQGGAHPGPSESGDLQSREYGVPEADIPGGLVHLVNTETKPAATPDKAERPADYHKYHGVPSDDGQYETPPAGAGDKAPRPAAEPKLSDAVPVYMVQAEGKEKVIRDAEPVNINVRAAGLEPSRICNKNPDRVEIMLLNEDSTSDIRIGKLRELQSTSAQGSGPAGNGALIWHGTNSYTTIKTQGELFAISQSSSSARLSVIEVTEVND